MKKYKVAVVGATGNVGREMLNILYEREFPFSAIHAVASSRSAGSDVVLEDHGAQFTVEDLEKFDFKGVDLVFSSPGAAVSAVFAPRAAAAG
ncbi:MAG: aspartate-semialdehyde dehydrogenase, partial [Alphaproteobacteria bacterium]|nr:aspartate-semialdehyde dehydrogenase [Alphaproteobacteria bacterium]